MSSCRGPWGGSENLWWETVRALRAKGHEVDILKTGVTDEHPRIRHLREISCRVIDLERTGPARPWRLAGLLAPPSYQPDEMRRHMLRALPPLIARRPGLVVVSQGVNYDGMYFAHLCRRLRLPYVLISHKASDISWPSDEHRDYWREAFTGAARSLFVSEATRRMTEEQCGIALANASVVRNPVPTELKGPLPWPSDDDGGVRLASVGRMYLREKGQDILLQVLSAAKWRERNVRLSLYGDGPNLVGLKELARKLGALPVSFEGHVHGVEAIWRKHHLLVLPSRVEGLPLVLTEAMLCGRPAVVTDVGGSTELVEDGVNGFVASSPSVVALDEALERAWRRRGEWPEIGAAAAASARAFVPEDAGAVLADQLLELVPG